ncbi:MAG TPA: putative glycoside hydrolase, partial [Leptolinea sp.]
WRNFWLERARRDQEVYKWDGVFLDNVEASVSKPSEYGFSAMESLTDASYQASIEANLRFIYINYFKPQNRPLYANIIALKDPSVWFRYMQYLDGAMIEDFAVGWNNEYKDPAEWLTQIKIAEKTQALGKKVILVSQGTEFDTKRQVFSLASYLLINNGKAYFRYTNSSSHDQNWLYENYKLNLGIPLGQRYKVGEFWMRNFTNGKVTVSPTLKTATIEMSK